MNCKNCNIELPISKKPNKSGMCGTCYRRWNTRRYFNANREKVLAKGKIWAKQNRSILSEKKAQRYKTDPIFRLRENLRTRLAKAIRRSTKTGSAVNNLGCSIAELRAYLESKFQPGMSWDNYGPTGWHIDHIKPLTMFDLSDTEQLKIAVHYTNLQPLWAVDNIAKSDSYDKH